MYLLKPNRKKVSRRGESQADRQTKEDYESMSSKTHKNISEKINKQWAARVWLSRGTSPYVHSCIYETVSNMPLSSPRL